MAIKGEKKWEKNFRWVAHIATIVVAIVATIYMFFIPQNCDGFVKEFLYCHVHPLKLVDILGLVIFYTGCVGLSGIWMNVTGDVDENPGRGIMWGSFIAALAGIGLIHL
jgi:hypothetical protein